MEGEGEELGIESLTRAAGLGLPRDLRLCRDGPRPWTKRSLEGVQTELTSVVGAGHRRRRPAVGRSTRATGEAAPLPAFWPVVGLQFDGGACREVHCRPRGRGRAHEGLSYNQHTRLATMGALPPRLAWGSPKPTKSTRKSVSCSLANSSFDGRSGSA